MLRVQIPSSALRASAQKRAILRSFGPVSSDHLYDHRERHRRVTLHPFDRILRGNCWQYGWGPPFAPNGFSHVRCSESATNDIGNGLAITTNPANLIMARA
jgi:hypothetical protein